MSGDAVRTSEWADGAPRPEYSDMVGVWRGEAIDVRELALKNEEKNGGRIRDRG